MNLNGTWKLFYRDRKTGKSGAIDARVPGNVETDMAAAGLLPEDLFYGTNITQAYKLETYDFTYEKKFDADDERAEYDLIFEGVDCCAEYFLNGEKIGESNNMLVEHVFRVKNLRKKGNELKVAIRSVFYENNGCGYDLRTMIKCWVPSLTPTVNVRRAQHTYGWDIMPRAVSAGIWKSVRLEKVQKHAFTQFYIVTKHINRDGSAALSVFYEFNRETEITAEGGYVLRVRGSCGKSAFCAEEKLYFRAGNFWLNVPDAALWWPKNYGKPALYDVRAELVRGGEVLATAACRTGIRTAELLFEEGGAGEFCFRINGKRIFALGTNWTPLSPYHSKDGERLSPALALLDDIGCNCVRCWGGNVYESDAFFDFCDERGIMVWQDFAFACATYPEDGAFLSEVREEAVKVIRRLRGHPSLVLWAGDNELDEVNCMLGYDPEDNEISRNVLKRCVRDHDFRRAYLPSSPYVSSRSVFAEGSSPEKHVWGERDYFKNEFYRNQGARFVSEIGYHGCVSEESAKKFIPAEELEGRSSESWILHSSDCFGRRDRIFLMEKQAAYLFGKAPEKFADFAEASQYVQAEAYKFFIENMRTDGEKRGIIWWNLLDGWPQFSDAVVDYYFVKKEAYAVIQRSQRPLLIAVRENENGRAVLFACNHSGAETCAEYEVSDADTREVLCRGKVRAGAGEIVRLETLGHLYFEKRMLLIFWKGGESGFNHYITGAPPYTIGDFCRWYALLHKIQENGGKF